MQIHGHPVRHIRLTSDEAHFVLSFDPIAPGHRLLPRQLGADFFIVAARVLDTDLPFDMPEALLRFLLDKPIIELISFDYGTLGITDTLPSGSVELLFPLSVYKPTGGPLKRPPKPTQADPLQIGLYVHIGLATTAWGELEASLAWLFAVLIGAKSGANAMLNAFGAITQFNVRLKMIESAMVATFAEAPMPDLEGSLTKELADLDELARRRNEIVHGCVAHYREGFAIQPPAFPTKYMKFKEGGAPEPSYAYTSAEVAHFLNLFRVAEHRIYFLSSQIGGRLGNKLA